MFQVESLHLHLQQGDVGVLAVVDDAHVDAGALELKTLETDFCPLQVTLTPCCGLVCPPFISCWGQGLFRNCWLSGCRVGEGLATNSLFLSCFCIDLPGGQINDPSTGRTL